MSLDILVCACGMRLKTPNATPGRVGKCPRCGSFLTVPNQVSPEPPAMSIEVGPVGGTFVKRRGRPKKVQVTRSMISQGLVPPPLVAETRFLDSLLYPLRGDSALAMLIIMPLGLAMVTYPYFALTKIANFGAAFIGVGLLLFVPLGFPIVMLFGNTLRYLGQVLVSSALGEILPPRSPSWSFAAISEGLIPWFWAFLVGVCVGGLPAMIYWINCGDVDWLDRIILVDLIVPGLAYAQMALLASLMFETPLAANPFTVIRAIGRVGWAFASPCVISGSVIVLLALLFSAVLQIGDGLSRSLGYWFFWFLGIYSAMILLRRLGLFCHRHEVILDWFPDRSRSAG